MGFTSPATDYTEQRLTVNSICNIGPNTLLFETGGGYPKAPYIPVLLGRGYKACR